MNADFLLDSMEYISTELIEHAGRTSKRRRVKRTVWAAAAACLCLALCVALFFRSRHTDTGEAQQWSASMPAGDYFKNSREKKEGPSPSFSDSIIMSPYALEVSLDEECGALEAEGMLPAMPAYPELRLDAAYNGDGSLYKAEFRWTRSAELSLTGYSDIKLTAAPREVHELSDYVIIRADERGKPLSPYVTATLRDGVTILAEGREDEKKTLTWQTAQGWYQIAGSRNAGYEELVALLDWFWAHPLSLERFGTAPEGSIMYSDREQQPEAFREQIPDFAALGYTAERERVNLAAVNTAPQYGEIKPIWFEGVYTRGETRIRWTVSVGADEDAWDACPGSPGEITEQELSDALAKKGYVNLLILPCMASLRLESGTAADAWEIVQSLTDGNP